MKITKLPRLQLPLKALQYLKKAHDKTPNQDETFWTSFSTDGEFYVFDDGETGACYIEWPNNILNVLNMGIDDIAARRDDVFNFFLSLMRERGANTFCIVSRLGWDRIFPELVNQGTIYTFTDGGS